MDRRVARLYNGIHLYYYAAVPRALYFLFPLHLRPTEIVSYSVCVARATRACLRSRFPDNPVSIFEDRLLFAVSGRANLRRRSH